MKCLPVFFIVLLLIAHSSQVVEHSKLKRTKMLRRSTARVASEEKFEECCLEDAVFCCAARAEEL
uniref:Conotoxin n=1 Tax=Conus andremenezi TaxID=1077466 RepID=A0A291C272_9COND|nr:conotoxin [Conus andremenezi]